MIRFAQTDADIRNCFAPIHVLRPHMADPEAFVAQVRRQQQQGYHLIFLANSSGVASVAGFRIQEFLSRGIMMYIDDLITLPDHRQQGYGEAMLTWLFDYALAQGCAEVHLNSGYQRYDAHRLYLRMGFVLESHHFVRKVERGK